MAAVIELGHPESRSFFCISYVSTGTQVLRSSSAAFQDVLAESWMGTGAAGTRTGAHTALLSGRFTPEAKVLALQ